jgi:nicotinamidase-related amidase
MNELLTAESSLVLVVDVQERLAPAMDASESAVARTRILVDAARILGVPVLASEQYPAGLGATLPVLAERIPGADRLAKTHFSCVADPRLRARLADAGRGQVLVAGMETHVCVLQTALDLLAQGWTPYLVEDAVASRRPSDRAAGIARMRAAGVRVVTSEMAAFEWLVRAGTAQFKEISRLVK